MYLESFTFKVVLTMSDLKQGCEFYKLFLHTFNLAGWRSNALTWYLRSPKPSKTAVPTNVRSFESSAV